MSDSDLHRLFGKLDEALGDKVAWALRRSFGKMGARAWRLEAQVGEGPALHAEGGTPELAIRTMLGMVLKQAQQRGQGTEEAARKVRDEVARVQRVVESL